MKRVAIFILYYLIHSFLNESFQYLYNWDSSVHETQKLTMALNLKGWDVCSFWGDRKASDSWLI